MAYGLDGHPRDFRQVFEILKKYFYFKNLISQKTPEEAIQLAKNNAWEICVRTFRGTTCHSPGVCFSKDIIYREGNIGVWDVIRENPEELTRFSVGKYNPANLRHIWVLNQLGISEQDLE